MTTESMAFANSISAVSELPDVSCVVPDVSSVMEFAMSRNGLYGLVIVLVAALIGLGIYVYQQQTRPGIEVRLNDNGISIDGNS